MRVLDPGHRYALAQLDGDEEQELRFVKRVGAKFPGNEPPAYEGVTMQEVVRALLDRLLYVDHQDPCPENAMVFSMLRSVLWLLESRAARVRGVPPPAARSIEWTTTCATCGHVFCAGECRGVPR